MSLLNFRYMTPNRPIYDILVRKQCNYLQNHKIDSLPSRNYSINFGLGSVFDKFKCMLDNIMRIFLFFSMHYTNWGIDSFLSLVSRLHQLMYNQNHNEHNGQEYHIFGNYQHCKICKISHKYQQIDLSYILCHQTKCRNCLSSIQNSQVDHKDNRNRCKKQYLLSTHKIQSLYSSHIDCKDHMSYHTNFLGHKQLLREVKSTENILSYSQFESEYFQIGYSFKVYTFSWIYLLFCLKQVFQNIKGFRSYVGILKYLIRALFNGNSTMLKLFFQLKLYSGIWMLTIEYDISNILIQISN